MNCGWNYKELNSDNAIFIKMTNPGMTVKIPIVYLCVLYLFQVILNQRFEIVLCVGNERSVFQGLSTY